MSRRESRSSRRRRRTFRVTRRYVGAVQPWLEARVGPQILSAYVDTVLVRPGDTRGAARCSRRSTVARRRPRTTPSRRRHARFRSARRRWPQSPSACPSSLGGGFVAPNELGAKQASTKASEAQLEALRADLAGKSLQVSDCTLRAPFEGDRPAAHGSRRVCSSWHDRRERRRSPPAPRRLPDAPETDVWSRPQNTGEDPAPRERQGAHRGDLAARPRRTRRRTVHFEIDLDPKAARCRSARPRRWGRLRRARRCLELPSLPPRYEGTRPTCSSSRTASRIPRTSRCWARRVGPSSSSVGPARRRDREGGRSRLVDNDKVIAKVEGGLSRDKDGAQESDRDPPRVSVSSSSARSLRPVCR